MPYGNQREDSLPITFHLTGEDAITQNSYWRREFALYYLVDGVETLWEFDGVMAGVFANIKETYDSPSIIFLNTSNGRIEMGPTEDSQFSFALQLTSAESAALDDWGLGVWDVYALDGSGRQYRLYQGNVALNRNVT